ncbi:hypothetical protein [Paraliomyxa miuraensis]|uniref:hypothetical protein n=1 Tax=Paraliomyxa miuraensis TaxID=376150 RepID=UPI00224CBF7D|nr:hypothetical protein [Paraliomyxa miuraensis]MCX4239992.1 hypothetical protein [Paraliomyxa miuraensis]
MIARVTLLGPLAAMSLLGALFVGACDKGDDGAKDTKEAKGDAKAKGDDKAAGDEGEPTLKVADGDQGVEGPVPPDTSMVFFQVEGALLPLACFDKDKGTLAAGTGCLDLVPAGAEVRVSGGDQAFNKKVADRIEPRCLAGSGKKIALDAEGLTGGAEFTFGAWPPSALKIVELVPEDSTSPAATGLDDETKAKIAKLVPSKGELTAHQVAEIDVDGNDEKDGIYSVFIPHPSMPEQYTWSGVFLAPDGNLDAMVLLAKSQSRKDVFEVLGALDVDGKDARELWVRMIYEEGAGDAVVQISGTEAKPLGAWSCGA